MLERERKKIVKKIGQTVGTHFKYLARIPIRDQGFFVCLF